jgi:transcriptional antiterminator NusG
MDHNPDSRGMTDDAPEEAEAASPTTEAGVSVPGPDEGSDPEAATDQAPPLEVEPMEEPVSEGVEVLDVPEEPPLDEVDEDEREAFGEVQPEPEPVVEAPTGNEGAEAVAPPDEFAVPEAQMEGPGEDGAEAVDLMERAEEAPEDQIPVEVIEEEAPEEPAAEPEPVVAEPAEAEAVEEPAPEPKVAEAIEEEAPPGRRDPFRGPGDWYVVHTYAGYENKVKANLESRTHSMQMEDKIFDVHIPMEDVMEIKGGKKQVVQRKVFPGYLLVKMIYDNDSWYVVRNTPGVTGFVSSGTGTKPTPLSRREVEKILTVKEEEVKPTFRLEFEEGDTVRIISGPFADFNGTISEINVDQSKLKVLVNIFDRETPVELGFDQVAKV